MTPVPRTVLGWNVMDIEQTVGALVAVGVTIERFTWFKQDESGITTFPDGARVAWFKDPRRHRPVPLNAATTYAMATSVASRAHACGSSLPAS
jgi:hypothetical protein